MVLSLPGRVKVLQESDPHWATNAQQRYIEYKEMKKKAGRSTKRTGGDDGQESGLGAGKKRQKTGMYGSKWYKICTIESLGREQTLRMIIMMILPEGRLSDHYMFFFSSSLDG